VPETLAFVAGATGYTGREVVYALAERGIPVIAHVRPDSPRLQEWRDRFVRVGARVDATPWEEEALAARLAALAPTHVFALLGTTRARARASERAGAPAADYEAVDYGLTAMLLRASARSPGPPRFIYLSSLGAREDTGNEYLRVRGRIEAELRAGALPHLIVRPSFITGPDREETRPAERIGAAVVDAALALAGALGARRLRARYRSRSGTELAEAIVRIALQPGPSRVVEPQELGG
jgi:uncharacterized protein YbjT (DUF2867 family)